MPYRASMGSDGRVALVGQGEAEGATGEPNRTDLPAPSPNAHGCAPPESQACSQQCATNRLCHTNLRTARLNDEPRGAVQQSCSDASIAFSDAHNNAAHASCNIKAEVGQCILKCQRTTTGNRCDT